MQARRHARLVFDPLSSFIIIKAQLGRRRRRARDRRLAGLKRLSGPYTHGAETQGPVARHAETPTPDWTWGLQYHDLAAATDNRRPNNAQAPQLNSASSRVELRRLRTSQPD